MKRISIFGFVLMIAIGMASCGNSQSQKAAEASTLGAPETSATIAKSIGAAEFKKLIDSKKDAIILDVRTPQEVAQGAIPGHVDINLYSPDFKARVQELDKDVPILVYCHSGGRSGNAMKLMQNMGFKEVYNLSGGIISWKSQGMPIK